MKRTRRRTKLPLVARQAEQAMRIAVSKVVEDHRRRGAPLVVWRNGKVIKIPA